MEDKQLIESCLEGNKESLEKLIQSIQGLIFNLSLRFFWNKMDAEDATQEILIKILTNLSKFDGRSKFNTWVYRVATNYLINQKQTTIEKTFTSFEVFSDQLQVYKGPVDYDLPDKYLLEKELKTGCTLAMLQCLNRDLRIAFILGSVLKIKSNIASEITQTTPANFRKRLETSRKRIGTFLNGHCGVYNPQNNCKCNKRIHTAVKCGQIEKNNLTFTHKIGVYNKEMEEINSLTGIYQNHGTFKNNSDFTTQINELLATKRIIND